MTGSPAEGLEAEADLVHRFDSSLSIFETRLLYRALDRFVSDGRMF